MNIQKEKFACSRDGMTIRGLYYHPQGNHLPIAIISHGFMANYRTTKKYAQWFAQHGYAAFCFDFNGGGLFCHSDKDTTKMTIFTERQDLVAVMDYATSLPETDEASLTLMGCSQGGVVSAMTAALLQEKVSRLVLFYPALCIPDDAKKGQMMFAKFDPNNIPPTLRCGFMKLGHDYPASVLHYDLSGEICQFTGPVLIVHGTGDKVVDYRYSQQVARGYPNAAIRLIPKGQHGFSIRDNRTAMGYVAEFIAEY